MKVIMLKISQTYNEKKIQKRNNNKKHNVNTVESFSFMGVNVWGGQKFPLFTGSNFVCSVFMIILINIKKIIV